MLRGGTVGGRALNEGRGANPGDTRPPPAAQPRQDALNEGRGANPGDTRQVGGWEGLHESRSTKAGARTPATPIGREPTRLPRPSAQRRPGREPRRHSVSILSMSLAKYAQRRPGREPRRHSPDGRFGRTRGIAQRRPGREPRRHVRRRALRRRRVLRSTKAGARTPATRAVPLAGGERQTRSTKAGARTPATRSGMRSAKALADSLNEGRGANPGDTAGNPFGE